MKLLILGNHTCGNRGDSAILRGLVDAISQLAPETDVEEFRLAAGSPGAHRSAVSTDEATQ